MLTGSEPILWNTVLFREREFEDDAFYGVHVVWDDGRDIVRLYKEGTIRDPLLTIKDPWWDLTPEGLLIDGYVRRGVYDVRVTLRMRPPGSGAIDPVLWRVEIVDGETGEPVDTCDPVQVVELDPHREERSGIRLQSKHHRRKLYWEHPHEEDEERWQGLGLDRLNRYQFTFRAATRHRGETIPVVATFTGSPVYDAARVLTGRKRAPKTTA